MKKLIIGLFIFGLTTQMFSQITKLPEVTIKAVNYKYLSAVDENIEDINVLNLEEIVAKYNLKKTDLYNDEYDSYSVTFYIPEGHIIAAYDENGNLLRTIERFKDVKLPMNIRKKVMQKFPNWEITSDVYTVKYESKDGMAKKEYKMKLANSGEVIRIKVDGDGNIM
ncbi:nicotinate-nucleotide adenylyltransferase [Pontimicrobium aquaticum]|uniref:Nicotinate-nucleotide adenylyltransferase n=1 Tax=Pontimicrobium aquaticum TaxID=2565367 RepID=A0A4U0EQE2_9FLAO|nr:nicotinate-nucleotide adenylyltransferase [Pontimicrobium aquaticum]TJY33906.1 nicotinate-nucleotide adenylyltransferase [Pontimicrobium aquaticum]